MPYGHHSVSASLAPLIVLKRHTQEPAQTEETDSNLSTQQALNVCRIGNIQSFVCLASLKFYPFFSLEARYDKNNSRCKYSIRGGVLKHGCEKIAGYCKIKVER